MDETRGTPKKAGTVIRRPDYARALDLIAQDPQNFYTGSDISDDISAAVCACRYQIIAVLQSRG